MSNTWLTPAPLLTVRQETDMICSALVQFYAKARGGNVVAVQSLAHLWEVIADYVSNGSEVPTLVVCYTGEQARGGYQKANTLHRVDRQWTVVLLRGHGFWNLLPDGKTRGSGVEYLTDSVEAVRDLLRRVQSITAEFPIDYKAVRALQNLGPSKSANVFLDGYSIEFSTANDIGAVAPS